MNYKKPIFRLREQPKLFNKMMPKTNSRMLNSPKIYNHYLLNSKRRSLRLIKN